jgi:transcriptional regulator with XRE-family HTH domain
MRLLGVGVIEDAETASERSDSAMVRLAKEIRRLRQAAGLSQPQLASRIGYSPQYVSLAERPKQLPSAELVRALDSALDASGELTALREAATTERRMLRRQATDTQLTMSNHVRGMPVDVTAINSMSQAFQAADRRVGGGLLYTQVLRYMQCEIAPRLLDPAAGSAGSALFSAAASLTEIAGWMAHDGGHDERARQHFDSAFRLASAAGNAALVANVCASMAHLATQLDQATDAVRIAEAGLGRAPTASGTKRLVARLHTMRARGYAVRGEPERCRASLEKAEQTLSGVDGEQPADWIAGFDEASLASETALCMHRLGDLGEAERQARQVIKLRSDDRVRARTFAQLTLARVLVDRGRVDEAAVVGRAVCAVAMSLTSARARTGLDQLGGVLVNHRNASEVTAFLSELEITRRAYQQDSVTKPLWPV